MPQLREHFESTVGSIREARRRVAEFAARCGMTPEDVFDVALAVGEACANAVEHGHSENGTFTVHCEYRAGAMNVEIRDYYTGEPWSSEAKTQRMGVPKNAGGLGLILMDYLMDSCELLKAQNGGTCVRLRKLSDRSARG